MVKIKYVPLTRSQKEAQKVLELVNGYLKLAQTHLEIASSGFEQIDDMSREKHGIMLQRERIAEIRVVLDRALVYGNYQLRKELRDKLD